MTSTKLNAKTFYYMTVFGVLLSLSLILAVLYFGKGELKKQSASIADLKSERDITAQEIVVLEQAADGAKLAGEANSLLENLLPAQKQQDKLIADIIYVATKKAGIPPTSIAGISFTANGDPSALSGTEKYKDIPGVYSYPFNFSVKNISYSTMLKLLKAIETNGRLVQVDNIIISPDKESPGQLSSVDLSLKAFLMP